MRRTLLLDLDGTLLENPVSRFIPAYMQAFSGYLNEFADSAFITKMLLAGTQNMLQNDQPDCTLEEVFSSVFYPAFNPRENELSQSIERFYREVYPSLKSLTKPIPEAIELVEEAFQRGDRVAIATNPLFPHTAIVQRLTWGGLSPEEYPFEIIPSFETFHFAKPKPDYLAEIMARLGWPEGQVVMVGDELEADILCADQLGIPSFWIQEDNIPAQESFTGATSSGNHLDLGEWLKTVTSEELQPDFNKPSAIMAILRSTPAALRFLCQGLEPGEWNKRAEPDSWCQTEILCHLRDVESEVNLPRIQKVLEATNPFLAGMDTDPWAQERRYILQNGRQALDSFIAARQRTLHLLDHLEDKDWDRTARHAIFGPTKLLELVSFIASHDRLHIRQLYEVIHPSSLG